LGSISKKDVLILISNSGKTEELKPIIQYANRNKIKLIGIVSKKNSTLYEASNIKLLIPEVNEAGLSIVPTSSTIAQLALGDSISIATLNKKRFSKFDFSRLHPAGNLGSQLKTVGDLMLIKNEIPFINENQNMANALKIITKKKLGLLIVRNKKNNTTGIITDGNIRKTGQNNSDIHKLSVKKVMTKNPITVDINMLAAKALGIMNEKKITSLCVHKKSKIKTIGIIHIHNILQANIE
jgi:arabinose-5-phosphate isomerase